MAIVHHQPFSWPCGLNRVSQNRFKDQAISCAAVSNTFLRLSEKNFGTDRVESSAIQQFTVRFNHLIMQSTMKGIVSEESIFAPFELSKNIAKFESGILRRKTLVFPRFFAFLADYFGLSERRYMHMLPQKIIQSIALLCPQ
jgi:hypothetical protein